ncbi:sensor histidine kinase [Flavonifractor plautii]|uniref:sensor histidine kinase n=1 Tax=Flavonifractor plautii TaxID=292800 RepID=UPI0034C36707
MCRRNIRESLTARIFLLTLLLLLGAGGLTFGLIAWATPITYVSVVGDRLQVQVNELTDRLALTKLADAGPILDVFVRESGAAVSLASPDGESVDTGSLYVSVTTAVQESDSVSTYTYGADGGRAQREGAGHYVTTALSDALIAEVTFADRAETYQLLVVPPMRLANQAVEALNRAAPCLALALLAFSLLCAVGYSRYLARPIVRISSIAGRMAELDFQWKCGETRRDEIGALGRSLDEMAERLSAASHELKTPVTILKGQLSGMLDGVGVYRDREKYLARSLQVAGRMEALVGELLAVSRMESDGASRREAVELSALTAEKLAQDAELLEQRGMTAVEALEPGLLVEGERALLGRAVENLLSNAALYSPEGAEIRVTAAARGAWAVLTVENTGARIPAEALPHLFEAFYRAEPSRSRATGGSGLGLYLVRMIVERHGGTCRIENSADGVRFTALLPRLSTENT